MLHAGVLALPVLWKFFELFPDPNAVLTGNPLDIANLMQPLGLNNKRAGIIHRLSSVYYCITSSIQLCIVICSWETCVCCSIYALLHHMMMPTTHCIAPYLSTPGRGVFDKRLGIP